MKKRALAFLLTLAIALSVLSALTVGVAAAGGDYSETQIAVAKELAEAIANFEDEYIPTMDFTKADLDGILDLIRYEYPLLFQISYKCSYSYTISNGVECMTSISPNYIMTAEEYAVARAEVETWADKVISLTEPDFTDLEYVVFFYDYLCMNYCYDDTLKIHDLPTFIKKGTGVCEAYTFAYTLLLQRVGVDVSFALSNNMGHVWNLVNVDGAWYHADVTWDCPSDYSLGSACHFYFLKSDAAFYSDNPNHHDWTARYSCTSTAYDNVGFENVLSPYEYINGLWYYVYDYDLYVTDTPGASGKMYLDLNIWWDVWSDPAYVYSIYLGGMVAHEEYLYVCGPTEIICVDTTDKTYETVFEYTDGDGFMYGFAMDLGENGFEHADYSSGIANVRISTDPGDEVKTFELKLYEVKTILPGDVDGDGVVQITDIAVLARFLAGAELEIADGADINLDGEVTVTDLSALRRLFA